MNRYIMSLHSENDCDILFIITKHFFCYLILRGDPLSQRLLFRGPTELLQHTHIQLHTTQSHVITNNQSRIHTHCVVSGSTFLSSHSGVQGWV